MHCCVRLPSPVRPRVYPGVSGGTHGHPQERPLDGHLHERREHQGVARARAGRVYGRRARRCLRGRRGEKEQQLKQQQLKQQQQQSW